MRIYLIQGGKGTGKTTLAKRLATDMSIIIEIGSTSAEMVLDTVSSTPAKTIILDLINPHDRGMLQFIRDLMMGHESVSQSVKLLIVIFEEIPDGFIHLPYVNYIQLVLDRFHGTTLALW